MNRMMRGCLLLAVSAACTAGIERSQSAELLPPPTAAPAFGINIGLLDPPGWDSLHPEWAHATFRNPRGYMNLLRGTGARWLRVPVAWADLADRSTGHLDLSRPEWVRLDSTLRIAQDYGFSVLGVLARHTWSQPPGYPSLNAWRTFVSEITQRLGSRVSHWSVWNEPNCDAYLSRGTEPVSAEDYAELVRVASPEIRRAGSKVVAGELSWWSEGNQHCRAAGTFLLRTLLLAGDDIDVVSITVYKPDARAIRATVDSAREVMREVPGPHTLWLTEFGVDRETPDDSLEADVASEMLLHPPEGLERLFFWHGFIWNGDDRRGMLRPTDSVMGANRRWVFSNPVPRLSYVAHAYARLGCDWREDCAAAAPLLPQLQISIEGPTTVPPNTTCSWSVRVSGGAWPYTTPTWSIDTSLTRAQRLKLRSAAEPFVIEVQQADALGRATRIRQQITVSRNASRCTQ
jgi:hypothetical protein